MPSDQLSNTPLDKTAAKSQSLLDLLDQLTQIAENHSTLALSQILSVLAGRGIPALLIVLSLPFCTPIQIPGFSTPFGILLGLMGLRMAFGKNLWWPQWLLEKQIQGSSILKLIKVCHRFIEYLQKFLHPRLSIFSHHPCFKCLNGLVVCVQALLLSLPLPIPMTNLFAALPILCMGFGLLEEDGLVIILSYVLSVLCLLFFALIFFFGYQLF